MTPLKLFLILFSILITLGIFLSGTPKENVKQTKILNEFFAYILICLLGSVIWAICYYIHV